MPEYKVAFIGCGKRAAQFAEGVARDKRCRVVALADPSEENRRSLKEAFGWSAELFGDHREMLSAARPEVVIGALWTPLHLPVYRDCVSAGVRSYLSEKPMAPTWAESLEMARIAEQGGCQLTFCHQRRFSLRNRTVRRLLTEGRFGRIERLDLYSPCSLLDCGTHTFDQALSFLGDVSAKSVLGAIDVTGDRLSFSVPVESHASGCVVFEGDIPASVVSSMRPCQDMGSGLRVLGSLGMIEVLWDGEVRRACIYDDPAWRFPDPGPNSQGEVMEAVVREVLDSLESGVESDISWQKALRATEIIFAFYESARRRERIHLPLGPTDDSLGAMLQERRGSP